MQEAIRHRVENLSSIGALRNKDDRKTNHGI
jgi:hypothetical protein